MNLSWTDVHIQKLLKSSNLSIFSVVQNPHSNVILRSNYPINNKMGMLQIWQM